METEVIYTDEFEKDVKKFLKKFPTLAEELIEFEELLIENPFQGVSFGAGLYKVRVASESKSKGKSGGFRVINYLITKEKTKIKVYVIKIYDKSEEGNVQKKLLVKLLKLLGFKD
jgi:mRNA-degrading endonuclease RelE of RelBE toxin-antitoxin system